ncbi:MAG: hypothetical protein WD295_03565, partial [Bacteroidota bacterium]
MRTAIGRMWCGTAILSLLPAILPLCSQTLRIFDNAHPIPDGASLGIHDDTPTRSRIDLGGTWSYSLDGTQWESVGIPSSFDFEGSVTFTRTFFVSEEQLSSSAFALVGLGVNTEAEILINEMYVGRQTGGYT